MENTVQNTRSNDSGLNKNGKLAIKLLIIFGLSLLLLIPQAVIQSIVDERHSSYPSNGVLLVTL